MLGFVVHSPQFAYCWYRDAVQRYEETGMVFCLAEAPSKEAAEAVHQEAHGLTADEIIEVKEGS